MSVRGLIAAALLSCCAAASAQGPWFEPFAGTWSGTGRYLGNDTQYELAFAPALDGHFVRICVRYRWRDAKGADATFAGEALYPAQAASALRGAWFDSENHHYATTAWLETPQAMVVHWGDGGSLRGRTEYRVLPGGELQVGDSFSKDGQWVQFSSARLKRASGA